MTQPSEIDINFRNALLVSIKRKPVGIIARIAEYVGCKASHISMIKHGKRYGDEALRWKIAAFFGYSYEDFLKLGGGREVIENNRL